MIFIKFLKILLSPCIETRNTFENTKNRMQFTSAEFFKIYFRSINYIFEKNRKKVDIQIQFKSRLYCFPIIYYLNKLRILKHKTRNVLYLNSLWTICFLWMTKYYYKKKTIMIVSIEFNIFSFVLKWCLFIIYKDNFYKTESWINDKKVRIIIVIFKTRKNIIEYIVKISIKVVWSSK